MAFDDGDATNDDHTKCLDEDDSPQAVEGGDEEENQHPGDAELGKINGAVQGAADIDRRQKCPCIEKADHDQENSCFLGQIL